MASSMAEAPEVLFALALSVALVGILSSGSAVKEIVLPGLAPFGKVMLTFSSRPGSASLRFSPGSKMERFRLGQ